MIDEAERDEAPVDAPCMADRLRVLSDHYYDVLEVLGKLSGRVTVTEMRYQLKRRGVALEEEDVRTVLQLLEGEGLAVSTEYQVTDHGRHLLDLMT